MRETPLLSVMKEGRDSHPHLILIPNGRQDAFELLLVCSALLANKIGVTGVGADTTFV